MCIVSMHLNGLTSDDNKRVIANLCDQGSATARLDWWKERLDDEQGRDYVLVRDWTAGVEPVQNIIAEKTTTAKRKKTEYPRMVRVCASSAKLASALCLCWSAHA